MFASRSFTSFLYALFAVCCALLVAAAPPKGSKALTNSLGEPIPTTLTFRNPNNRTVWETNTKAVVTWFTPDTYVSKKKTGTVVLGQMVNGVEQLDSAHPLAQGFDMSMGIVTVDVPQLPYGEKYIIALFDDQKHVSQPFAIIPKH